MNIDMKKMIPLLCLVLALASGCGRSESPHADADKHDHTEAGHGEMEKGPHGGRLLEEGDFSLELAIFEKGVPPEFRAWARRDGKPLAMVAVKLSVTLERIDGTTDVITFEPKGDYLRGTKEVYEPHSFTVAVQASVDGKAYQWRYDSFEGRTTIPAAIAKEAGVAVETAESQVIRDVLPLYGVIVPNPENVREVSARYPGVIRRVTKTVGDSVRQGQLLAVVESDESLRSYEIVSPISGVVTMRHANPGEQTGTDPMFTITNLSSVWAELSVFPRDLGRLRPGQRTRVRPATGGDPSEGRLAHLNPAGTSANQALAARVVLDNPDGRWTPGLYVNAEVLIGGAEVPVAIRQAAVQRFRDWQVVFRNEGDVYEAAPLELGRSDGEWIEVLSGLPAGARYVASSSFVVKADIEKAGASHDH